MKLVDALRTEDARTENGMMTNSTSLSDCVDFFFTAGAMRNADEDRIERKFIAAFAENPIVAMKLLFWARDIRGGAGERRLSRIIFNYMTQHEKAALIKNMHLIPEYGRWDDLGQIILNSTGQVQEIALNLVKKGLEDKNGLCAKWLPRPSGKHKALANIIRKSLGLDPKSYRKMLVELTTVVESAMCAKDYGSIEYSHVPSLAMARYQKAFERNDEPGFSAYKLALESGKAKVNAGAVYPYDVIKSVEFGDDVVADQQWKSLPNWIEDSDERILPVCDVSGSMETPVSGANVTAMDVCVSLGLYISERNKGPFQDYFMTFSSRPELQKVSGDTLIKKISSLETADWGMSTDLEKTFRVILNHAKRHHVPESEMPTTILILSDMEFNQAVGNSDSTAFKMAEEMYAESGYKLPKIVFWNLASRHDNIPVRFDENGTALISGFSPSILSALLKGQEFSPISIMMAKISEARYDAVTV